MKTLHRFVVRSYLGPLIMTFFIVMFILLMQFLWKYIDDLVGKGLGIEVILELLLYASAGLVPMALPLSTLLASLMTLGNLGENNELLAMKSAGISLPRIMSPLIVLTIAISIGAFFFSNNVLPYTNLKISSLLYDVKQQRPELQISVGVFNNDIEGLSIKIGSKDPRTNLLHRIMIYDHRSNEGNLLVTVADSGYIRVTDDEQFIIITLFSGTSYEEMKDTPSSRRQSYRKFPARSNQFTQQKIVLELKGFGLQRSNEDLFKSSFHAMNLRQLRRTSDSLFEEINERKKQVVYNLTNVSLLKNPSSFKRDSAITPTYLYHTDSVFLTLTSEQQLRSLESALASARQAKNYISSVKDDLYYKSKYAVRHSVEWHRKFSLSFACFVFFFIGAPLGAIIRKGGLGMPVVVSILFFVVYYIISLTGEKFAREMVWEVNTGMWVSSFIFLPLGIFLSYKATTDSVIMNADYYILALKRFSFFFRKKGLA